MDFFKPNFFPKGISYLEDLGCAYAKRNKYKKVSFSQVTIKQSIREDNQSKKLESNVSSEHRNDIQASHIVL